MTKEMLQELEVLKAELESVTMQKNKLTSTLNAIISSAPGNLYWKNIDGKYEGCNHSQLESLGLKKFDDLLGKTLYDIFPESLANTIEQTDNDVI